LVESLPLFPLETVLFPGMVMSLHIFEERYRALLADRADDDPIFGVVLTRTGREVFDQPSIHQVGTAASLLDIVRYDDGRADIAVRGGRRFQVREGHWDTGYLTAVIEWLDEDGPAPSTTYEINQVRDEVQQAFDGYLDALARMLGVELERGSMGNDPAQVAYAICSLMPLPAAQRQRLLEADTTLDLLEELLGTLRRERELLLATGIVGGGLEHPGTRFSPN
jgi:Lon protease-like protein